jgi:hypothetical protein
MFRVPHCLENWHTDGGGVVNAHIVNSFDILDGLLFWRVLEGKKLYAENANSLEDSAQEWSSDRGSRPQIQGSLIRFQALPDFWSNSGSGTGSTQPREDN